MCCSDVGFCFIHSVTAMRSSGGVQSKKQLSKLTAALWLSVDTLDFRRFVETQVQSSRKSPAKHCTGFNSNSGTGFQGDYDGRITTAGMSFYEGRFIFTLRNRVHKRPTHSKTRLTVVKLPLKASVCVHPLATCFNSTHNHDIVCMHEVDETHATDIRKVRHVLANTVFLWVATHTVLCEPLSRCKLPWSKPNSVIKTSWR